MVLLYNDIDDSEIENMDDPEEEQEVYRVKSFINCFYEILSSGNLKKFDSYKVHSIFLYFSVSSPPQYLIFII